MFPGAHNVWGKPRLQGEKEMRGPLPAATQGTAADGAVETSVKPQYTYILTELMSFRPGASAGILYLSADNSGKSL